MKTLLPAGPGCQPASLQVFQPLVLHQIAAEGAPGVSQEWMLPVPRDDAGPHPELSGNGARDLVTVLCSLSSRVFGSKGKPLVGSWR